MSIAKVVLLDDWFSILSMEVESKIKSKFNRKSANIFEKINSKIKSGLTIDWLEFIEFQNWIGFLLIDWWVNLETKSLFDEMSFNNNNIMFGIHRHFFQILNYLLKCNIKGNSLEVQGFYFVNISFFLTSIADYIVLRFDYKITKIHANSVWRII